MERDGLELELGVVDAERVLPHRLERDTMPPPVTCVAEMRQMMRDHLDLTLQEAAHQLGGDYPASVADYDAIETQILAMADMLSRGIIKQFPQKFA